MLEILYFAEANHAYYPVLDVAFGFVVCCTLLEKRQSFRITASGAQIMHLPDVLMPAAASVSIIESDTLSCFVNLSIFVKALTLNNAIAALCEIRSSINTLAVSAEEGPPSFCSLRQRGAEQLAAYERDSTGCERK